MGVFEVIERIEGRLNDLMHSVREFRKRVDALRIALQCPLLFQCRDCNCLECPLSKPTTA